MDELMECLIGNFSELGSRDPRYRPSNYWVLITAHMALCFNASNIKTGHQRHERSAVPTPPFSGYDRLYKVGRLSFRCKQTLTIKDMTLKNPGMCRGRDYPYIPILRMGLEPSIHPQSFF